MAGNSCASQRRWLAGVFVLLTIAAPPSLAQPAASGFVTAEVLVRFRPSASDADIAAFTTRNQLESVEAFPHLRIHRFRLPAGLSVEQAVERLGADPIIEFVEPNYLNELQQVPPDPRFNDQWYLHNTGQVANGVAGTSDADIDWLEAMAVYSPLSSVIVAVIDSGVSLDHPDIIGKLWANTDEVATNHVDDDGNGFIDDKFGWDFVDSDSLPLDENGHGTLVASIIGGATANGIGGTGVAPNARIMALRVADDFGSFGLALTSTSNVLASTTYAAQNGARIINASFGGGQFSMSVAAQMEWLDQQGVLVVAAAGNDSSNNNVTAFYPANYPAANIISVAATDAFGKRASFSNYGPTTVDIAAPGNDIFGADISRSTVFFEDFESGAPGWLEGHLAGSSGIYDWTLWDDPNGNTYATDSVGTSGNQVDYAPNTNSFLRSPPIDLTGVLGAQLTIRLWYELEENFDWLIVEVTTDGGTTWTEIRRFTGTLSAFGVFREVPMDLSDFEGETIEIRARLLTDHIVQRDGVYLQWLRVSELDFFQYDGTQYQVNSGTSFAAPVVAGVAALLMAQRPDLTHRRVRELILSTSAPSPMLSGLVATAGVVNARAALVSAIAEPEPDSDGDGVPNSQDAFPNNPNETADTDHDGVGNNADTDDDGDGVPDASDRFPLDIHEFEDTDNDGTGNSADADDDGDGMPDTFEITSNLNPRDPADASRDDDGDGVSNLAEYRARTASRLLPILQLLLE
jgi:subtilisin family serine protease